MSSLPFDLEPALHRHAAALRQLAADLLGHADADDAVQEVWLSAMQRPPRHGNGIGGWLATSLRNVACKLRRGERRRARREAAAARTEASEDHAAILAREEQVQQLMAAVHSLELPVREAIWRRYFEGLPPREIAQKTGEPLATVKSRLQRGLRELRSRLGSSRAADWRSTLAAAFGLERMGVLGNGATTAWSGVFVMAAWMKALAAAAIVATLVMVWSMREPGAPGSGITTVPAMDSQSIVAEAARSPRDQTDAPAAINERQPVQPAVAAAPRGTATLRGRCVDGSGAPLAGCTVGLIGWGGNAETMREWLLTHAEPQRVEPAPLTTSADGTFAFTFPVPPPFQFALDVTREGCCALQGRWPHLDEGATVDVGDVVLRRGVRVTGRVVDGAGRPQGEVTFNLRFDFQTREAIGNRGWESVRSLADGSFATHGWFAPGSYTVESMQRTVDKPTTLALSLDRPVEDIVVVLRDESSVPKIAGRVVDEAGNGIERAIVAVLLPTAPYEVVASTKADGSFLLRGADSCTSAGQLQVKADGFELTAPAAVAWGSKDVEVRLVRAPGLTLRVEDPTGTPIADYRVRTVPRDGPLFSNLDDLHVRAVGPFENGTVRISDVTAGRWLVLIDFPEGAPFVGIREHVQVAANGPGRVTLRAESPAQRLLRVSREDGRPVAGLRVQLCERMGGAFGPRTTVFREQRWLWNLHNADTALVVFEGSTDVAGRLLLQGPGGRDLALRVRGRGFMPILQPGVRLEQEGDLTVNVGVGARLVGHVGPKEVIAELRRRAGLAPGDRFPVDWRPYLQLKQHDAMVPGRDDLSEEGDAAPFEIDDDGAFDVAGLPVGTWQARLMFREKAGRDYSLTGIDLGHVTLAEGAIGHLEAELSRFLPGTLEGEVTFNGAPLAGAKIRLEADLGMTADGRPDLARSDLETDASGHFTHRGSAGVYRVEVWRRDESGCWRGLRSPSTATVARGETTRQTFAVIAGVLEVKLLDPSGQPIAGVEVSMPDAGRLPATRADGSARVELATQTVTLRVLPKRLQSPAAQTQLHQQAMAAGQSDPFGPHWISLGTAMIEAGKTTALELRLPPEWEK